MKADVKTETEVMGVLNKLIEGYNQRDIEGLLTLYASDPDMVTIGTGIDEKRIGLAERRIQLERDFSQVEEISVEIIWYSVSAAGSVAWVTSDVIARGKVNEKETSVPMRATFVLEKRSDKWLIMHSHISIPSVVQKEGESWPTGSS